ncbi:putative protein phosphatase 1 regulatory subunit 42 [Blattamonas nauphoetae]|uniref:Uncharacterized protein n=1 Tax=Blattamonas nauphoetae TaxID=2049346 RepID=A0ABQ9X650_9EUKA|nr:putative protein phosphatase 1 regulatory subunit 42 [Blattamonas nauphoetae]
MITEDLILKSIGLPQRRKSHETNEEMLQRLVHLALHDKGIKNMEGVSLCPQLNILSLRSNKIEEISGLNHPELTSLDLQENKIRTVSHLENCPSLTHLYLNENCIETIESFEGLHSLEELHIAFQTPAPSPEGQTEETQSQRPPLFSYEILQPISRSLVILNISHNHLKDLSPFACCRNLMTVDASENDVDSFDQLVEFLNGCYRLRTFDLTKNPLSAQRKFYETVIVMSLSLRTVNGKEVLDSQREFCLRKQARDSQPKTRVKAPARPKPLSIEGSQPPVTTQRTISTNAVVVKNADEFLDRSFVHPTFDLNLHEHDEQGNLVKPVSRTKAVKQQNISLNISGSNPKYRR